MAHDPAVRARLRAAYIGGLPLEQAAEQVGVPSGTARNWFRAAKEGGDDWDKFQRASLVVAGGGIEQALGRVIAAGLLRCDALMEKLGVGEDPIEDVKALATLGDTVAKLRVAARTMMPETDRLAIETSTIKAFAEMVCRAHPALAEAVLACVEAYAAGQR